jgi:hypothetical protein
MKAGNALYEMSQKELNDFRKFDDMARYSDDLCKPFKIIKIITVFTVINQCSSHNV